MTSERIEATKANRASDCSLAAVLGPLKTRHRAVMTANKQKDGQTKRQTKKDRHVRHCVTVYSAGSSELPPSDTVKEKKLGVKIAQQKKMREGKTDKHKPLQWS